MAKILRRNWTSKGPLGKRVRHTAFGYTISVNGKRERKFSSDWLCEADALKALTERQQQIQNGRLDRPANVTLGQAVERYLTFKAAKRSLENDRQTFAKQLLPFFGANLPIRQLTAERISAFEERRMTQVSVCTTRNELACLRHLLRLACRKWNYLDRVPEIELPRAPEGRTRFLSQDEITRLLQACSESKNKHLRAIVIVAINTAMRKGEIMNLEWERIELDKDLGFNASIRLYNTKNGKPRGIHLNRQAAAALTSVEPDPVRRVGIVFKRQNGEHWGAIRTALEAAVTRAALPDFRFHDLRHTAASWMAMRGRPLIEIKEVLGHASIAMTMKYAHLSPAHQRTAVESLDGLTPVIVPLDQMSHKMAQRRSAEANADTAPQKILIS
jgi:integrase